MPNPKWREFFVWLAAFFVVSYAGAQINSWVYHSAIAFSLNAIGESAYRILHESIAFVIISLVAAIEVRRQGLVSEKEGYLLFLLSTVVTTIITYIESI